MRDLGRIMKTVQVSNSTQNPMADFKSQLKSIKSQLSQLQRVVATRKVPIPEKVKYVNEREEGLRDKYHDYSNNIIADYIYGLYHPDVVFNEGLDIKSPSYMPVPTTTFRFKETFTIAPNAKGNVLLFWSPNFLGSSHGLRRMTQEGTTFFSNVLYNNSDDLQGNAPLLTGWKGLCFKHVVQDFDKYRLTSASISVKYTGKVIDQSGLLSACASYTQCARTLRMYPGQSDPIGEYEVPTNFCYMIRQFGDFDTVRQGQWAQTVSVTSDPDGLTCVYVPTDPLNQVFVLNGETIDSFSEGTVPLSDGAIYGWFSKNANLSYAICGSGLNPLVSNITVEAYYNFEIIVTQDQYPYFNVKSFNSTLSEHSGDISRINQAIISGGMINKTKLHSASGVWSKLRGAFQSAYRIGRDVFPILRPLIKSLI